MRAHDVERQRVEKNKVSTKVSVLLSIHVCGVYRELLDTRGGVRYSCTRHECMSQFYITRVLLGYLVLSALPYTRRNPSLRETFAERTVAADCTRSPRV